MPENNDLFQQIFQQYGVIGLLVALVVGQLITFLRTKNMQTQVEVKANELVNEFARQERHRADRLEERLNTVLQQLDEAQQEVFQLRAKVAQNAQALELVPTMRAQVQVLTVRVAELEASVDSERQKSQRLEAEVTAKAAEIARQTQHIRELENQLGQEEPGGGDAVGET